ncbi:cell division protein SepF (plasmid) [Acaryochloris sp. 'Moss Beach']|uniref:cell division protein SepF n=1 Tax=Acaryochloris sp. 'Moss Beach' TaxID=2740837 RepID=UPI001F266CFA|nr:cell division protein SepF [Acaryochloris sp. 'Moss Beach']UJB73270.1 cell division protein SepF [Acaryochloris sp. 'Moss Beach']
MNNLIPLHRKTPCEILLSQPSSFTEAEADVQSLKKGQLLLVNLADLPSTSAQRISDYLAGSAYSLCGQFTEVGNGIYLFAPPTIPLQTASEITDEDQPPSQN